MTINLRKFLNFPSYLIDGITYKLAGFLFVPRPRFVCFPVTFRCNSRCQMCNVWQNPNTVEEIDLKKIEEVFSDRLFLKVEEIVLHGGEPTLRKDISDIYKIIIRSCPRLKNITSSTNGLNPRLVDKRINEILSVADLNTVNLTFSISIDGLKQSHDKIRGIEGCFERAIETLRILKSYQAEYPIEVKINTVIQPQNIQDLEALDNLAREYDVDINFQPLMIDTFFTNSSTDPRLQFSSIQCQEYQKFIKNKFFKERTPTSLYWKNYIEMMDGKKRTIPCAYDRYVLSLYPTGEVLPCAREDWIYFGNVHEKTIDEIWFGKEAERIRKRMRKEVCPTCNFYCGAEYSMKKEFFTYFGYYFKSSLSHLLRILKV